MVIMVTKHALTRHAERVKKVTTATLVEQSFKKVPYRVIEPADDGKVVVELKGVIWVIHRTNSRLTVISCYGPSKGYVIKKPHLAADAAMYDSVNRWMARQDRLGSRRAYGN